MLWDYCRVAGVPSRGEAEPSSSDAASEESWVSPYRAPSGDICRGYTPDEEVNVDPCWNAHLVNNESGCAVGDAWCIGVYTHGGYSGDLHSLARTFPASGSSSSPISWRREPSAD